MNASLITVLSLGVALALLSMAARRLRAATSILMLVAGAVIAFLPGLPAVALDPDLVILLLLPPLLYWAGVGISWRGFRAALRPILLLAIGCVLLTAAAVAAVVHAAFGVPWAVGFVLGAIVSPPDAVAPIALLRSLRLPRRITTILEGESLVNDATALVAFSFALGAVATGSFSLGEASLKFAAIVVGELLFGFALGWFVLRLRLAARDPRTEVLIALLTPFLAFWPPHALGGSGVIACVTAGLYVSWNGPRFISPATRLQGFFVWDLVTWGVEALIFLLIGMQAYAISINLSGPEWAALLWAGTLVTVTTIVVRFVWVFAGTYGPCLVPSVRRRESAPSWREPFLVAFTGLRGVVSLAAALSIPYALGGMPFPHRDLILFVTFFVILATLIGLGTPLSWIARTIGLEAAGTKEAVKAKRDERAARLKGIRAVLKELEQAETDGAPAISVAALRRAHADRLSLMTTTADETTSDDPATDTAKLQLRLIAAERSAIMRLYESDRLGDEARRRIERELDLEEARSKHAQESSASAGQDSDPATTPGR